DHVVGVLGDADGGGPGLRDQHAEHMTAEHPEHAEVEQRAAQAKQAALVDLRGAGGPAELVVAVPPDVAEHERGERDVGQDHPQLGGQGQTGVHRRPSESVNSDGSRANGSSPTSSSGGPSAASSAMRRRSAVVSGGRVATTAASAPAYGEPLSDNDSRSSSITGRCSPSRRSPPIGSTVAANSSSTGRWSGSSSSPSSTPACR